MSWEALGAIGEIVGAIAVVVTLVYLTTQIRQNTKTVQAASFDSSISSINAIRQSAYENPELMDIWARGMANPEKLSELERERYRFMIHNMMWSQWNVYFQSQVAELPNIWAPQKIQLKRVLSQQGMKWFLENYKHELESNFQDEIDLILSDDDT